MGEQVGTEKIEREEGKLYYVNKEGYVYSVGFKRKGSKKKVSTQPIVREEGYMYYLDKSGYVAKVKMSHIGRWSKHTKEKAGGE
jgi:hypothetical protein